MVVIDSIDKIKRDLGINEHGPVANYFVELCYRHMDKYVPMDKGLLRTIVDLDDTSITYMSPYAAYQYYGIHKDGTGQVINYTTPGTGPYWDQLMISADMPDIEKEMQKFIER